MAGVMAVVSGQPAICLPAGLEKPFLLGWVNLSRSALEKPRGWGIELIPGEKPMRLKGGDCMVFGVIPEGYRLSVLTGEEPLLKFEVGHEYFFALISAERSVESYEVTFCFEQGVDKGLCSCQAAALSSAEK